MQSNVVIAQQRCGSGSQLLFGEGASNSTTTSSWVSPGCVAEAASDNITRTTYIMPRLVCCEGANENPARTKHEPFPIDCARGIPRAETNADHDLLPVRYLGNHKLRPLHHSRRYRISDLFLAQFHKQQPLLSESSLGACLWNAGCSPNRPISIILSTPLSGHCATVFWSHGNDV